MAGYIKATGHEYPTIEWEELDANGWNEFLAAFWRSIRAHRLYNAAIRHSRSDMQRGQLTATVHADEEHVNVYICTIYDDLATKIEFSIHQSIQPVQFFALIAYHYGMYRERDWNEHYRRR